MSFTILQQTTVHTGYGQYPTALPCWAANAAQSTVVWTGTVVRLLLLDPNLQNLVSTTALVALWGRRLSTTKVFSPCGASTYRMFVDLVQVAAFVVAKRVHQVQRELFQLPRVTKMVFNNRTQPCLALANRLGALFWHVLSVCGLL